MSLTSEQGISLLNKLAKALHRKKGSDVIINSDSFPVFKVLGKTYYLKDMVLGKGDVKMIIKSILSSSQWKEFVHKRELNFMLDLQNIAFFRVNVFFQRGMPGMVMRLIPKEIPTISELNLPKILNKFSLFKRGLILFSGATGVGKSTSLASMVNYRNLNISGHILTIEDPIEFVYENEKSIVTQREVGVDTDSYQTGLKNALRQAPDVILIGEIRDVETMRVALALAETGHLVLATVHAESATTTLARVANFFPSDVRKQKMYDLSNSLKAIVSQRLLMRQDGESRVPAIEILSNTPHIKMLISENKINEIKTAMKRSSLEDGTMLFDSSIFELYENEDISYKEAIKYVESITDFNVKLRADSKIKLPETLDSSDMNWDLSDSADEKNRDSKSLFSLS